jgi:hypothetical protein
VHKLFSSLLLGLALVGSWRHYWSALAILVVVITLSALPVMAAEKNVIRPQCWEENKGDHVDRHCTVPGTSELKPEARQQAQPRPQPQVQAPPPANAPGPPPPPAAVAAPPPPPVNGPNVQVKIGPHGISVPGLFHVGPEGFNILGFTVTNPNYHPDIPAPGYAPEVPGPAGGCITNARDGFVEVRVIPNGAVLTVLTNGVPVAAVDVRYDQFGIRWSRIGVGGVTGWSMATSLNCGGY